MTDWVVLSSCLRAQNRGGPLSHGDTVQPFPRSTCDPAVKSRPRTDEVSVVVDVDAVVELTERLPVPGSSLHAAALIAATATTATIPTRRRRSERCACTDPPPEMFTCDARRASAPC